MRLRDSYALFKLLIEELTVDRKGNFLTKPGREMHCIRKLNSVDTVLCGSINLFKTKNSISDVVANTNVLRIFAFKLNLNA